MSRTKSHDPERDARVRQRFHAYVDEQTEVANAVLLEGAMGKRADAQWQILRDAMSGPHELALLHEVLDAVRNAARADDGDKARQALRTIAKHHALWQAQLQLESGAFGDSDK